MRNTTLLLLAVSSFILLNCEKHEPTCYLPAPSFTVNGQAASGETIELELLDNGSILLSAPQSEGSVYHWSGPNGFESASASPEIPDATNAMSGEYTLMVSKGICTGSSSVMSISTQ
ncbi:MAG TPA: hypothetical protein VGB50_00160 [Flavobacterium sp.]|jgi:hypothetical protein